MVHGQTFAGVVAEHGYGMLAETAAQPLDQFHGGGGVDEVRIHAQDDLSSEVAGGEQGCGDPAVVGDVDTVTGMAHSAAKALSKNTSPNSSRTRIANDPRANAALATQRSAQEPLATHVGASTSNKPQPRPAQ